MMRSALAILMLLLGWACVAQSQVSQAPKGKVLRGDERCTACHGEYGEFPVLAIGKTKHGTVADARTPTCTTCHGESERHVNTPVGTPGRSGPDRMFGRHSKTPMEERSGVCLTCHQGGKRIHWQLSAHAGRNVACSTCHQVHAAQDKVRDKLTQAEVCFTCHKEQRAQLNRPSHHPVREGKVACSDCHNPHGSAGEKMLVRDNVNDTCYTCHMEKRGPFVRTHQPVQENCAICHNPHGTINDNMLKQRAPFLCQQCHEPTSHRGNLAGFEPGTGNTNRTRGLTQARACLNCHTNIHGTNNVINDAAERSFRR